MTGPDEGASANAGAVPPPLPPDDPAAWYAPDLRAQYEVHPGVVVTVRRGEGERFRYEVREPAVSAGDRRALSRIAREFEGASLSRPVTREGTRERMAEGFDPKHRETIDRIVEATPAARRRIGYYALRDRKCLGGLTPLALDPNIETADARTTEDRLVVHTADYAPAVTTLPADPPFLGRFAAERVESYRVEFRGFSVPVVVYRDSLLGADPFPAKYAAFEPDLLPGDEELIAECTDRLDAVERANDTAGESVREQAQRVLSGELSARDARTWFDAARSRVRAVLADRDSGNDRDRDRDREITPPTDGYADDRLADLVYYVLRDRLGEGPLTIPVRDPNLEDVEVNRTGERMKVVPRDAIDGRIPTNLSFASESAFVDRVTRLAATGGAELTASNPTATVTVRPRPDDPPGGVVRCSVALPAASGNGPHVAIRKHASDPMTPVDLVARNGISTELVALLWMACEHHRVVLFAGASGAGKTTLVNAVLPFVPLGDRPITVDDGACELWVPHETGVSLTTRDREGASMADLATGCAHLNPDVVVIDGIDGPDSFGALADGIDAGYGILGSVRADGVETFADRALDRGLAPSVLRRLDLVAFVEHVDGDRYVGDVIEFLSEPEYRALDGDGRRRAFRRGDATIYWNAVASRGSDGEFRFDGERIALFDRLADVTDRSPSAVGAEFRRKHRYVRFLCREGIDDYDALWDFLSDLHANEAATVERVRAGLDRTTDG